MSFSYGNPAEKLLYAVRFELQDIDENAALLEDAEIEYAITVESSILPAEASSKATQSEVLSCAAHCMEALSRRFSALADRQSGVLKIGSTKRAKEYTERAKELRARAQGMHSAFAGGISVSEKEAKENQTNREGSMFRIGQFQRGPGRLGNLSGWWWR